MAWFVPGAPGAGEQLECVRLLGGKPCRCGEQQVLGQEAGGDAKMAWYMEPGLAIGLGGYVGVGQAWACCCACAIGGETGSRPGPATMGLCWPTKMGWNRPEWA